MATRIYTYPVTDVFGLGDGIAHTRGTSVLATVLLETVKLGESLGFGLAERLTKQEVKSGQNLSLYDGMEYLHHVLVVASAVVVGSFLGATGSRGVGFPRRLRALGSRRRLLGSGGFLVKRSAGRVVHGGIVLHLLNL